MKVCVLYLLPEAYWNFDNFLLIVYCLSFSYAITVIYLVRICIYKSNRSRNICLFYFLIIADNGSPRRFCRFKDPQTNCYRCDVCFKCFTRRDHLRTHKKNLHGEDAGPFACIVCSQLYKNVDSLRKHIAKFHVTRAKPTDKTKLI